MKRAAGMMWIWECRKEMGFMNGLIYFFLPGCPFCRQAQEYWAELEREEPKYAGIQAVKINERAQADLADRFDYWLVPCFFLNGRKLHEGAADKAQIRAVLDQALSELL